MRCIRCNVFRFRAVKNTKLQLVHKVYMYWGVQCDLAQYKRPNWNKCLIFWITAVHCTEMHWTVHTSYWGVQCNLARYKRLNWKEANAGGLEDWKQIGTVNCNKAVNYIGVLWEKINNYWRNNTNTTTQIVTRQWIDIVIAIYVQYMYNIGTAYL